MKINPYKYYYNKELRRFAGEHRNCSTLAEIILWNEVLKGRKLGYQFHRQRPVLDYIGDFFCKELKLFIETDGITHEDETVKKKDMEKTEQLISYGYSILRFKDTEVEGDIENVRNIITDWIKKYEDSHIEVLDKKFRKKRS
jgi:very-short-patch-repair endonuclease